MNGRFRSNLSAALRSTLEHRGRTILASVGVAVAIMAIVLLSSIGVGVERDVRSQVEDLGANVVVVVPGHVSLAGGFNPNLAGQSAFKESDRQEIMKVAGVKSVAMLSFVGGGLRRGNLEAYPFVVAATPEWFVMNRTQLKQGKFYSPSDEGSHKMVLGSVAAALLFPDTDPIGSKVLVNEQEYEVVGVTQDRAQSESMFSMQSLQNVAYVPFSTFKSDNKDAQIDRFMIQTDPGAKPETLVANISESLGRRLTKQQFSVLTQEDLLGVIYSLFSILSTLVIGLTSISLVVAWFGIMTVILMAVNERRKEIGVRKATGARNDDLFAQFLIESLVIGLVGTVAGIVLGIAIGYGIAAWTALKPVVTPWTICMAVAMGIAVGSVFGVLPAIKAARQDPVVSLREE